MKRQPQPKSLNPFPHSEQALVIQVFKGKDKSPTQGLHRTKTGQETDMNRGENRTEIRKMWYERK